MSNEIKPSDFCLYILTVNLLIQIIKDTKYIHAKLSVY